MYSLLCVVSLLYRSRFLDAKSTWPPVSVRPVATILKNHYSCLYMHLWYVPIHGEMIDIIQVRIKSRGIACKTYPNTAHGGLARVFPIAQTKTLQAFPGAILYRSLKKGPR